MDREYEVIELGVVTADTKGSFVAIDDEEGGLLGAPGLTAD